MRPDGDRPRRIYRTGSPRDYLAGAALLVVAAWFAWQFSGAEHLRDIDRPIMAAIAAATFGGLGIRAILRGGMPAVILSADRLCVRDWLALSRCFPLTHLVRMTWSYRYADGSWTGYHQGRAWLEFEFAGEDGALKVAVVDYAGRSRHAAVEQLVREVAECAELAWDPRSDPLESTDLPGAEVVWRRGPAAP